MIHVFEKLLIKDHVGESFKRRRLWLKPLSVLFGHGRVNTSMKLGRCCPRVHIGHMANNGSPLLSIESK